MPNVNIKLTAGTDMGLVRTNNEDNFVINKDLTLPEWFLPNAEETIPLGKYGSLLVVADGMGGANAGEVASSIAIETVQSMFTPEALENIVSSENNIRNYMAEVIKAADLNIVQHSKEDSSTQGMGTTIVLCWLLGHNAHVAWCGDSRCYIYNQNKSFYRLSKDHSFVQELVDKGEITEEEALHHPFSNVITRCLGDTDNRAVPEVRTIEVSDGDLFLLCTDGLCGLCQDNEILAVLQEKSDNLEECRDQLIQNALAAGGHDNVTVALAKVFLSEEETTSPLSKTKNVTYHASRRKLWAVIIVLLLVCIAGFINEYHSSISQLYSHTVNLLTDSLSKK